MPPSGHSHSSHSSHSSSSHSSSSRSFSSSSRSSSYSSGSRSSYSGGPSRHSTTSRSSASGSDYSRRSQVSPARPRVNQPAGFRPTGDAGRRPSYYYGRHHDYIYYPVAWIDDSTGTSYQAGYYDENGNRYDNVAFEKDGKYENVVCHCDYCGLDTVMDLSAKDASSTTLQCPNCGAPITVKSFLDQEMGNKSAGASGTGYAPEYPVRRKRRGLGCLIAILIFLVLGVIGALINIRDTVQETPGSEDVLYLSRVSDDCYAFTEQANGADKLLVWDGDADSYYDESTDAWLWYNTEVEPPVWQYWYEGISSDYGDYGWMEHDYDGWYIEATEGNWIDLPGNYDTSRLWYIQD